MLINLINRKQQQKTQTVFAKPEYTIEIINAGDNVLIQDGDYWRRGVLKEVMDDWGKIEYVERDGSIMATWLTASFVWKLNGTQAEIDELPHYQRRVISYAFLR